MVRLSSFSCTAKTLTSPAGCSSPCRVPERNTLLRCILGIPSNAWRDLKCAGLLFLISRRSGHRVIMYAVQKLPGMPLPGLPKPSWPCTREVLWFVSPCNFLCCGRDAVGLPDGKDSPSGGKRYRAPCSATDSWWHDAK